MATIKEYLKLPYDIGGAQMSTVSHFSDLGVIITEDFAVFA